MNGEELQAYFDRLNEKSKSLNEYFGERNKSFRGSLFSGLVADDLKANNIEAVELAARENPELYEDYRKSV